MESVPVTNAVPSDPRGRSPVLVLILTLITCHLYGLLWLWQVGTELKAVLSREDVNPGLDVLLTVLTFGLWGIYLMYRYPQLVQDAHQKAGLAPNDVRLVCVGLSVLGLGVIAMVILQVELNKLWAVSGDSSAAQATA